jgi:hypothetical protein
MHYIHITRVKVTQDVADRINERVQAIDPQACFRGPLDIPGSDVGGWLERPNDGTNDYNHVRERNKQLAAIVREEIDRATDPHGPTDRPA